MKDITTKENKPSDREGQKGSTAKRMPFLARDFYQDLLGKSMTVKCQNGINIDGMLLAFNPFEIQLELATHEKIVVCKHAVTFYSEKKPAAPAPAEKPAPAKEFHPVRTRS